VHADAALATVHARRLMLRGEQHSGDVIVHADGIPALAASSRKMLQASAIGARAIRDTRIPGRCVLDLALRYYISGPAFVDPQPMGQQLHTMLDAPPSFPWVSGRAVAHHHRHVNIHTCSRCCAQSIHM
jgi:hypothetical protein